jgi:hypothetical protein
LEWLSRVYGVNYAIRHATVHGGDYKGYPCFESVKGDQLNGWREGYCRGPRKKRQKRNLRHKVRGWQKRQLRNEVENCDG